MGYGRDYAGVVLHRFGVKRQAKGEFAKAFPVLCELHGALTRARYDELLVAPEVLPET